MIVLPLEADRVTVKIAFTAGPAGFPSVTVMLLIDSVRASSSVIVPKPKPEPAIVAFVGFDRFTENVSFGSTTTSPITWTMICFETSPGLNVTVPPSVV